MSNSRYLIVGSGLTGDAACRGIRELDVDGSIVLVGEEEHPPYSRPPLSKGLWKGDAENTIWRGTEALGVDLRRGRRIVALDLEKREARDDHGQVYGYEKLLLATGGRPRRLPVENDEVVYFRTLDDYREVRSLVADAARFCVIGGGFIGSEIAAALVLNGSPVEMIFPEAGIAARAFPTELSAGLVDYYREQGVAVSPGSSATTIERVGDALRVMLGYGRPLEVDAVVAGLGLEPNVELAAGAGLPTANGIVVDAYGRVGGRTDVFAAGDVARFPSAALQTDLRVEHEDHAKSHGRRVGANMAGANERYDHLPFFYSDLFDLGYEAVGDLDARLDMLVELSGIGESGVVYYLDPKRRARGVLLWNLFGRVDDARELILSGDEIALGALGEPVS